MPNELGELRKRLTYGGVEDLCDADLLHLILASQFTPQTSQKLHRLLATYPRLHELMQADFGELCREFDLSSIQAAKLLGTLELARRIATPAGHGARDQIRCALDIVRLVMPQMAHLDHEEMRVILLNNKLYVVGNLLLYKGTVNRLSVRIAEVFKPAISRKCTGIIIVHNHPGGDIDPSDEDRWLTEKCIDAGKVLDIEMVDHIIVAPPRCYKSVLHEIQIQQ